MVLRTATHSVVVVLAVMLLAPLIGAATGQGAPHAPARVRSARRPAQRCTPVAPSVGPTIIFGHDGGSLRPRTVAIYADGRVLAGDRVASDTIATLEPAAVAGLARLARTGGFWALRTHVVTRPTRIPDFARSFIEVRLTCGTHRVGDVVGDEVPKAFGELRAVLEAVTDASSRR